MHGSRVLLSVICAVCALSVPHAAKAFPFRPEPASFAVYLNTQVKSPADGSKLNFSNLGKCTTSQAGSQKVYQCREGTVTISGSGRSQVCALSTETYEGMVAYQTGPSGRGQWKITTNGCRDLPGSTP